MTRLTSLERDQMSPGTLAYIHQVEAGFHIGGEFPLEKIENDAARRRGFHITLPDWGCGIHGHNMHAAASRF